MSARHAALLVHALAGADRTWLWERLSDAQRTALEPLLRELDELGIARDHALVQRVLEPAPRAARLQSQSPIDELDGLPADRVAELLAGEPRAFVVRLLSLRGWRWRDHVAEMFGLPALELLPGAAGDRFIWHAARSIVERSRSMPAEQAERLGAAHAAEIRPGRGRRTMRRLLWGGT